MQTGRRGLCQSGGARGSTGTRPNGVPASPSVRLGSLHGCAALAAHAPPKLSTGATAPGGASPSLPAMAARLPGLPGPLHREPAGGRLAFHYVELRRVHPVSDRRLPRPLPGPEARGLGNQRESGINPNMKMRVRAGGFGRRPPCVVRGELESHASRQPGESKGHASRQRNASYFRLTIRGRLRRSTHRPPYLGAG